MATELPWLAARQIRSRYDSAAKDAAMGNKPKGRIGGRDAITGEFVTIEETKRRPATTVREIIPLPGNGDSKPQPKPKPKG